MPEPTDIAMNAGEQPANAPASLPLKTEDQFRLINQRLDILSATITGMAKPPQFRLADALQLGVIVVGLIVAGFTALGVNDRVSDIKADLAGSELRIKDNATGLENRLGIKLDKLSDQFSAMDERTSHLEGQMSAKPIVPEPTKHHR
jgi:hypothetical protein